MTEDIEWLYRTRTTRQPVLNSFKPTRIVCIPKLTNSTLTQSTKTQLNDKHVVICGQFFFLTVVSNPSTSNAVRNIDVNMRAEF